mmetsp:Transcript_52135/g.144428  ORF Transcript_52135/g.144428 Transcript_52135/m.144428 type:complete len:201 (-) Transcript_52135:70-672(-)
MRTRARGTWPGGSHLHRGPAAALRLLRPGPRHHGGPAAHLLPQRPQRRAGAFRGRGAAQEHGLPEAPQRVPGLGALRVGGLRLGDLGRGVVQGLGDLAVRVLVLGELLCEAVEAVRLFDVPLLALIRRYDEEAEEGDEQEARRDADVAPGGREVQRARLEVDLPRAAEVARRGVPARGVRHHVRHLQHAVRVGHAEIVRV